MYTIMQTAKLNAVNPEAYLRDTLGKIAEGHPINRINQLMRRLRKPHSGHWNRKAGMGHLHSIAVATDTQRQQR